MRRSLLLAAILLLSWVALGYSESEDPTIELARQRKHEEDVAKARGFIKALEPELEQGHKPIKFFSERVSPEAIRWVQVDGEGDLDLVFWTEGAAGKGRGFQEAIFVARVLDEPREGAVAALGRWVELVGVRKIHPTVRSGKYLHSAFHLLKGRVRNDFCVAALGWLELGASASIYLTMEVLYDGESGRATFKKVVTGFPLGFAHRNRSSKAVASQDKVAKGRRVIKQMSAHLIDEVGRGSGGLSGRQKRALGSLHRKVDDDAIHWVDVNWDDLPELVFWTKGVDKKALGGHDFLFVVEVLGNPKNLSRQQTKTQVDNEFAAIYDVLKVAPLGFVEHRFTPTEDDWKRWGYNSFMRGVLTFVEKKADGKVVHHGIELRYNRYEDKMDFRRFRTSFPVGVR